MSLGPYEPSVAHLLPLRAADAVAARILVRSIDFPFSAVFPRVATSPALARLRLLLTACPTLAMLLLLVVVVVLLLLLLVLLLLLLLLLLQLLSRDAPFPTVHMVSGSGERATAPSRNQIMRPTIYRSALPLDFAVRRPYPVLDHGQGQAGGILHYVVVDFVIGPKAQQNVQTGLMFRLRYPYLRQLFHYEAHSFEVHFRFLATDHRGSNVLS